MALPSAGPAPMRLDPILEAQLRAEGALTAPNLDELPLSEALSLLRAPKPPYSPPTSEAALVEDLTIPSPHGHAIPIRLYRPPAPSIYKILLHFHGGGWVGGSMSNDDARCHALSQNANIIIASVAYRLAPEHPYPAGLEDAYAALLWLQANASEIGANPRHIAIGGTSAGGNLAAATTILARDRNGPKIRFQLLTYPICDTTMSQPSYTENANAPLLTTSMMAWFQKQYVPPGTDPHDPLIAPLQAPDLRNLPPALILTAECDPLRDEAMQYATRLRAAGVPATSTCYLGMTHGFITRSPNHLQSQTAMRQIVDWLVEKHSEESFFEKI
jgi:acetyl esterase